jgi:hypothetical protein
MTLQYILTFLVLVAALVLAIRNTLRFFTHPERKCDTCSSSCTIRELKTQYSKLKT